MSATGLEVFDRTIHATNIWLSEISDFIGPDRQRAWRVLGAVLQAVRDRVPLELAVHLGAELPLMVRGLYYDQWHLTREPAKYRTADEFLDAVAANLRGARDVDVTEATGAVFTVLGRHLADGQLTKVRDALPEQVRRLWRSADSDVTAGLPPAGPEA